jgi:hypothetical protein
MGMLFNILFKVKTALLEHFISQDTHLNSVNKTHILYAFILKKGYDTSNLSDIQLTAWLNLDA